MRSQWPPQPAPWLRLAVGVFVAAQTMLFGLAINITPPDDPATRMLLHTGMLAATLEYVEAGKQRDVTGA